ncbi:MAG: glycosyltransferase family 10, partial [Bacteroidota bacterium]
IGPIAYGGHFRNNQSKAIGPEVEDKLHFISKYQFHICPENSNRSGYVTEKIFHAHQAGVIPVYWGSDNAPEPMVLQPTSILFYYSSKEEELLQQVKTLYTSESAYRAFRQQDLFVAGAAEYIYERIQALEQAIVDHL